MTGHTMGVEDEDSFRLQRACGFRPIGKHLEDEEIDLEVEKPGTSIVAEEKQEMNALKGIVKNRQIVVEVPTDWPEGCEVVIEPVNDPKDVGDDEGPMTEEEIKTVLAAMNQIEPLLMTPKEEAQWKADLRAQREHDLAAFEERAEKLKRIWE